MLQGPFVSRMTSPHPDRRIVACLLLLGWVVSVGCGTLGDRIRERERLFALEKARTQARRGQCAQALASLDRAETQPDLGRFARESTLARARCYEQLGEEELAEGHRRLLADFYDAYDAYDAAPDGVPAPTDGLPVLRVRDAEASRYERPPASLRIVEPRYTPFASRARLVGRVVVAFDLSADGRPTAFRVLEMPHPLLATWSMEALARTKSVPKAERTILVPGRRYITTFEFSYYWAERSNESS